MVLHFGFGDKSQPNFVFLILTGAILSIPDLPNMHQGVSQRFGQVAMQTSPAVPGASRATSTGKSFYFGPALIASFLVGLLVSGCASAEKSTAGPDVLSFLQDGQTSREEIISHLGSPSRAIQNERFLFYRVGHDRGGYFVGELNHRRWADVRYSLVLVFDDAGVLKEHSIVSVR